MKRITDFFFSIFFFNLIYRGELDIVDVTLPNFINDYENNKDLLDVYEGRIDHRNL